MHPDVGWRLEATYATLPAALWERHLPMPMPAPHMVWSNARHAEELGVQPASLTTPAAAAWFTNGPLPPGAMPLAQAYAGHQFGGFSLLGDGRALLLGEQRTPAGTLIDIHLKGSGPTRYARRGDGRAALGPMLREVLISEALHAQGIPTTRALAVVSTGDTILRHDGPLPGAVLVRTASSHLRVGTLQFAGLLGRKEVLEAVVAYAVQRHVPAATEPPAVALLHHLIAVQTALVAQWMAAGFIHGVMNTDNMTLSGESIDFGPCAFVDAYDHGAVFSSIDTQGRYAFANQPRIALWNIARAAEALLPLLGHDDASAMSTAQAVLATVTERFADHHTSIFRRRLGLAGDDAGDAELIEVWNDLRHAQHTDHGASWLDLLRLARGEAPHVLIGAAWDDWLARWRARDPRPELLAAVTPRIQPRNHRVEEALAAAVRGEWAPFERLLAAVQRPYDDTPDHAELHQPPPASVAACHRTFCGT